jgi:hypothetical protein
LEQGIAAKHRHRVDIGILHQNLRIPIAAGEQADAICWRVAKTAKQAVGGGVLIARDGVENSRSAFGKIRLSASIMKINGTRSYLSAAERNTGEQTIFMRIRMLQAGDEEASHIWKPQLGDDEEGSGKDSRRVKRAPDMLVVKDLEGEVITAQRQPELKKKAAYFRVRQMREVSFQIRPASFSPRPNVFRLANFRFTIARIPLIGLRSRCRSQPLRANSSKTSGSIDVSKWNM